MCTSEAGRPRDELDFQQQRRGRWRWRRRKASPGCSHTGETSASAQSYHCWPEESRKVLKIFCVKQMLHQKCFCLTYHWVNTDVHTCLQVCLEIIYGLYQGYYKLCTTFCGKLLQSRAVAHGDTEYLTKACLKRKRERNLKNFIRNWVDVVENFSVAYLRLPFEALRITLVFCFNPGRLNWDLVNACGVFSCLIFKKWIFNFIWSFVFFKVTTWY